MCTKGLWPLEIGKHTTIHQTRGAQAWDQRFTMLRRETADMPAGRFDSIVVERHVSNAH
jgi:hypothetical protein